MIEGIYENHHLLCPTHGRTSPDGEGRTKCGCTPHIFWEFNGSEAEMHTDDNMGIGSRYV